VLVKLLLDEMISPAAAVALAKDGFDVWHVRDRGLEGATDHELLERAYEEDRVLVTLNVGDFERLTAAREVHAGVVFIEKVGLVRGEQIELIKKIAAAIAAHGALINEALRVDENEVMTFETRALSTSAV
jgi:predicted nuclease of predicted toxin-antitoxin system